MSEPMDFMVRTYQHNCPPVCTRYGEMFVYRPECRDGVELGVVPRCLDTGVELTLVAKVRS